MMVWLLCGVLVVAQAAVEARPERSVEAVAEDAPMGIDGRPSPDAVSPPVGTGAADTVAEATDPAAPIPTQGDDELIIIVDDEAAGGGADGFEGAMPSTAAPVVDDGGTADAVVLSESDSVVVDTAEAAAGELAPTAERTWVTTELTSRLMVDTKFQDVSEDVVEWWNVGRLTLDHRRTGGFRAVAEGLVRWGVVAEDPYPEHAFVLVNGAQPKWTGLVELRQGYVSYRSDRWAVSAGQKIYVWGKNEVLSPADVINPRDLRYDPVSLLTSPKDAKVPVFAAEVGYWSERSGVVLVLTPFFSPHKFFATGRDFALATPGTQLQQQLSVLSWLDPSVEDQLQDGFVGTRVPEESPLSSSVALRGSTQLAGWDLAATTYYGWDRTPRAYMDPDLLALLGARDRIAAKPEILVFEPELRDALFGVQQKVSAGQQLVRMTYERMWMWAVEAEGVLGDFVVRGDAGYSPGQLYYASDLSAKRHPVWSGALGLEYMRGESLFVQLTAFGMAILNAPAQPLLGLERADTAAARRSVGTSYGVATNLRWTLVSQDLEVSVSGLYNISPGDHAIAVKLGYAGLAPHNLRLGLMTVNGPAGSLGRQFRGNDFAYVEYASAW